VSFLLFLVLMKKGLQHKLKRQIKGLDKSMTYYINELKIDLLNTRTRIKTLESENKLKDKLESKDE
jgi:hypothetical protein